MTGGAWACKTSLDFDRWLSLESSDSEEEETAPAWILIHADSEIKLLALILTRRWDPKMSFIANAEDTVYQAARIVKEEAKAVEAVAQCVERMSGAVQEDVQALETFVHQVDTTINSTDNFILDEDLSSGWHWKCFPICLFAIVIIVVLINTCGTSLEALELQTHTHVLNTYSITIFHWLLINVGIILRFAKFFAKLITRQTNIILKLKENVDKVFTNVNAMAKDVDTAAHIVEGISQEIEKDVEQVQGLIKR